MADYALRVPENVPGAWYVEDTCIACGLCEDRAPHSFRNYPAGGYNYVYHQPVTPEELNDAEESKEACPVEAIGNDGPAA